MDALTLELLNGLSLFAILAIVALGLGIVFGLMGIINLAHGEFVMIGAYVSYVVHANDLNHWVSVPVAAAVLFVLGAVIELVLIRRIHRQPEITILATFGLSVCLRQAAELVFTKDFRSVPNPVPGATRAFGVLFPTYRYLLVGISVVVVVATLLAFTKSRFGLTVRAIVADRDLAEASGIRTGIANFCAFGIGAATAGIAGALVAPLGAIEPQAGLPYLPGAFLVVIVGGFNKLWGVVAGALTVAAVQIGVIHFYDAVWAQIASLGLAVLVLQFRRLSVESAST
ncbi:branched-chain amino acid ABC transporter permease [Candidatus Poriferisodalis sp.]|uniref:branched-chain amino acid ABC transporter permease n=1 Tax=Candidatus Poriferisodalis sp. TaxID=3101277 RepID=UPI003B5AABFB